MTRTIETITAKIYLGLKKKYGKKVHDIKELENFLQEHVNKRELGVTVTPTTFIYNDGKEYGAIIRLINYPRFLKTKEKLKQQAEEIAKLLKKEYKQKKVSIEYQYQTLMRE